MSNALTYDDRVRLTQGVMRLLHEWKIPAEFQVVLLGLPEDTRSRSLERYRRGTPFPESDEIMLRVEHLIAIYDALRTTYPSNASMSVHWLSTPNRHLDNRAPMAIMLEEGVNGLAKVLGKLDCTLGWI